MTRTRHFEKRMSQRGIQMELVDLALKFGYEHRDGKVVLNRKGIENLMAEIDRLRSRAQAALKRGGVVVVAEGDTLITTYRVDSYHRSRTTQLEEEEISHG